MAILNIPDKNTSISDAEEIAKYLEPHGIWYQLWEIAGRVGEHAQQDEILQAFSPEVTMLMKKGGYVTADVIAVNPETPGLDAMLSKFSSEHTHSEDEVRFVVDGQGIFHINPGQGDLFSVEMEAGDAISVPAGTRHWFNLCKSKTIKTIRLFQDITGWTPHYVEDSAHVRYEPVCFGLPRLDSGTRIDSKVKP